MDQIFSESDVIPVTWVSIKGEDAPVDFAVGSLVKIVGTTKGRGFQGVVKRHGFAGGPKTHGQKNRHRAPGSLGPTAPQRVIPGRRMGGRMGGDRQTLRDIKIVDWKQEERLLALNGSLPGRRGSKITIFVQ
ncbi:MAG: 50S ribosomal protein L3 [Candidatus Colwellbacteria bacterium]|nr:50S ribosomal protein L3 [Candidatus Colwellbacteria bacterium]